MNFNNLEPEHMLILDRDRRNKESGIQPQGVERILTLTDEEFNSWWQKWRCDMDGTPNPNGDYLRMEEKK